MDSETKDKKNSEKHSNLFTNDILKYSAIVKPILIDVKTVCSNCGTYQTAVIERGQSLYRIPCERCDVTSLRTLV